MNPDFILQRLREEGEDAPLARLIDLIIDQSLETPLEELILPRKSAEMAVRGLQLWLASDRAEAELLELEARLRAWLEAQDLSVGELLGAELQGLLLELAERPKMPSREVTLFLLDREPMRALLRTLLFDTLVAFGKKLRASVFDNPLAKRFGGLGGRLADRARANPLGALAGGVVDAFSDEVDRKAAEYADAALAGLMPKLADLLSDPRRAEQQAALREELSEGLLELSTSQVADELERGEPAERSEIIRRGLSGWARRERAVDQIETLLRLLLGARGGHTLGAWLAELGLEEGARELARASLEPQLQRIVRSEAFATWVGELVRAPGEDPAAST